MINGHGDDIHNYDGIRINFSSNIYAGFDHQGLFEHLKESIRLITNYPEPSPLSLERQIAEFEAIDPNCVMVTNGATEGIYLIARTFFDLRPLIPQPTFSEYKDACLLSSSSLSTSMLNWYCVPNNPTGHVISKQELIKKIIANPDDIFVVDSSYAYYTKENLITAKEVVEFDNVILIRSMTKDYGVPGLRLGHIVGNTHLLNKVRDYRMPWSVNALAIEAGHYLLNHRNEYQIPVDEIIAERQRVENEFNNMNISTTHSDSHMLLCRLTTGKASELKNYLVRNHGILIRDAINFESLTPQHFRIAVQKRDQNDELLKAIHSFK